MNVRHVTSRDQRCRTIESAVQAIGARPGFVAHRYPVTPYHADYLGHVDRAALGMSAESAAANAQAVGQEDVHFGEVAIDDPLLRSGAGFGVWPAPPFAKEGWYQAYHLIRAVMADDVQRKRADDLYQRLTHGEFADKADQIRLERDLIAALTANCEMAVIGYRLRREYHNDDFSNGIENILIDSQAGSVCRCSCAP